MLLQTLAPFFIVLLWSAGLIGAKFGLPFAEPLAGMVSAPAGGVGR